MMDKEKERELLDQDFQQILVDLSDFNDSKKQKVALSEFNNFGIFNNRLEAIPYIITILQESKDSGLRLQAVKALGHIGKNPELVLPALTYTFRKDRSPKVKEQIPFALFNFQDVATDLFLEALACPIGSVRSNTIKVMGFLETQAQKYISILENELADCQDINGKCQLLTSLVRLEGLDSQYLPKLEVLINDQADLIDNAILYMIDYPRLKRKLESDKKQKEEKQKIKEKWYKRKEIYNHFFSDLNTFGKNESGRRYQNRYSDYIVSIMKTRLFTLISLESFTNFPSRRLPDKITSILDDDFHRLNEVKRFEDKKSNSSRSEEYTKYSEIFHYIMLIKDLGVYNLNYILNKFRFNDEEKRMSELQLIDVYNESFLERLEVPANTTLDVLEDGSDSNTKIIDHFVATKKEIIQEIYNFKQYALYQEVCIQFMNFEAFLFDSIEFLVELYPKKDKNKSTIIFDKNKKLNQINLDDFINKNKFDVKINYLIENSLISKSWLNNTEKRQKLDCFRTLRNCVTHYNGRKVKKYHNSKCLEDTIDDDYIFIDPHYIDEILVVVIEFSKELYNEIAKLIKS